MEFAYVYRSNRSHPSIVEDLLALADSYHEGFQTCMEMLMDFYTSGRSSRFALAMHGPLWELKSRSRGGQKGGARVYFAWVGQDKALLLRAEVKTDDAPTISVLNECIALLNKWRKQ